MRIISILLIIAGLVSGWFMLQKKVVENRAGAWAAQLAPHLKDQDTSVDKDVSSKNAATNFYWILYYFDKLVTEGLEPDTVLTDACNQIKMPVEKAALVRKNLLANYETAKKYRIYEDITNVVKMEQGDPPTMKMSGWEDELAVIGHIVPPHLSPEGEGSLANFILMPAIVRDAQTGQTPSNILEHARAMERARIITKISLEEIVASTKKIVP